MSLATTGERTHGFRGGSTRMLKCSRRSDGASLEERDVKRNLLRRCARVVGKLAEVRSSEEAVRAYQSLGWKGPYLMTPNRLSRAHAPGENPAHPVLKQSAHRSLPNQYAELKRLIKQRGLLDLQPAYFAGKSLLTLGLLAVGLTLLLILDNLWLQLLNAAYLAIVFVQISLIAHDMGHRQFFFRASWKNDWLTLILGNLLLGISRQWWIDKHNDHHGHPNQLNVEPDVDIPLLAFEEVLVLNKRVCCSESVRSSICDGLCLVARS